MNLPVFEVRRPKWLRWSLLGAIVASACSRVEAPPTAPITEPTEPTRALESAPTSKPSYDTAASEALWQAAKTGDMATVTRLAQRPDVNLEFSKNVEFEKGWEQSRFTALAYAAYRGDEAMMELLIARGAELEGVVVVAAVQAGDVALVERLVLLGASPEAVSDGLGYACYEQDVALIRKLLELGADVNTIGYWGEVGRTCLGFAASEFNEDMLGLLVKAGADLEALDQVESTAFVAAVMEGSIEGAAYLLEQGARSDARDANGWTAVHLAVINNDLDMLEWLLAHGGDPNARDNWGETPLFRVRDDEALPCMKALVKAGADVNVRNDSGSSALDRLDEDSALRRYLLAKGARPTPT
jgi:ankyrin repeat protein